jgi:hypothetical protein
MKKSILLFVVIAISLLGTTTALAGTSYPWRDHAPPFDFLFENHIDTHQQGKLTGQGKFEGFFYIKFTGDLTEDSVPIATHGNCPEIQDDCTVGWLLKGVPMQAKYLGHEMGQHPTWCVEDADLPNEPGYSHFHWLNESSHADGLTVGEIYDGYLLKLNAIDTFFFDHHGGFLVTPGIDLATHANIETDC